MILKGFWSLAMGTLFGNGWTLVLVSLYFILPKLWSWILEALKSTHQVAAFPAFATMPGWLELSIISFLFHALIGEWQLFS